MVGVINTQDLGSHPYYNLVGKPTICFYITGMIYFIFHCFTALVINSGFILGIITHLAVNRQDNFFMQTQGLHKITKAYQQA